MDHKLEIGENPRQLEKEQLIRLMNIFADEIFIGKYDFDRGTYRVEESLRQGEHIPEMHVKAVRLAREEILFNVLRYVRECAKHFFLMQGGQPVDDEDLFQRQFPDLLWEHIRKAVRNISALPIWITKDPTISSAVFGGKQTYEFWKNIFDTGSTPGGQPVLAKALALNDLLC